MRTLLLADDNVTVQRVIALTFAREPVRVVTASDGHQAMDRVVVDRPDIVLAGTTLPQVNGYDLARFVKSKAESRNVPVLLLSGAFETIDEAQLKSSGANGVIEKPVEPLAVISRVKELLGITSEGDALPRGGRVTPAGASAAGPGAPLPTVPRLVTSTRPMPPVEPRREPPESRAARCGRTTTSTRWSRRSTRSISSSPAACRRRRHTSAIRRRHSAARRRPIPGRPASGPPRATDSGNPVYEVDEDWFAEAPARDRSDTNETLRAPELPAPPACGQGTAGVRS